MKAIGYVRKSKKSDDRSVSVEVQTASIRDYCTRLKFDLAHVLVHDGISGRRRARFALVDEVVKRYGPKIVVFYNLDRLARDCPGVIDYFTGLHKRGIEFHESTIGKIDWTKAINRFTTTVRAAADALYAELIGEKSADALKTLKDKGRRYCNIPPLGFIYVADGYDHKRKKPTYKLVALEEEQRALTIIRECRALGLGARRIRGVLAAANYTGRMSIKAIHAALRRDH